MVLTAWLSQSLATRPGAQGRRWLSWPAQAGGSRRPPQGGGEEEKGGIVMMGDDGEGGDGRGDNDIGGGDE